MIAALSFSATFAEAALLSVLVPLMTALSLEDRGPVAIHLGPLFARDVTVGVGFILCGALTILRLAQQVVIARETARLPARFEAVTRNDIISGFTKAPWSVLAQERQGHLQELLTTEVGLAMIGFNSLGVGFAAIASLIVLMVSALLISPLFAIAILVAVVGLFFGARPIARRARRYVLAARSSNTRFAHSVAETVFVALEMSIFNASASFEQRAHDRTSEVQSAREGQRFLAGLVPVVYQNGGLALVLGGLAVVYAAGRPVTSAAIVALLLFRGLTYGQQFQMMLHALTEGLPHLNRLEERLARYRSSNGFDGSVELKAVDLIEFDAVSFEYQPGLPALRGISFRVAKGASVGIVGPSGSGKSTLLQVILRLRHPTSGEYRVNSLPVQDYSRSSWARRVGFVPQESHLIDGTVEANIRFFRDATTEMVSSAARSAGILEEVLRLDGGLAAPVGDQGFRLSGGQRQRLCIARAILARPDVLVLDEPTSALDVHAENAVQDTLFRLAGDTTIFVVAHRLSTLSMCDYILILEDGWLRAFDTRENLAAQEGYYTEALRLAGLAP